MPTVEPFSGIMFPAPDIPVNAKWKSKEDEEAEREATRTRLASEHRETAVEQAAREQREHEEYLKTMREQSERDAATLREAEETRRKQAAEHTAEIIVGEEIRQAANSPDAIAKQQEAERKRNSVKRVLCSKCGHPAECNDDGSLKSHSYSLLDTTMRTQWVTCNGPVDNPDTYIEHRGIVR